VILADIKPLRVSPPYRRLWSGLTVSQLGQQMTAIAVAVQVYALTRSNFSVGLLGLVALVPMVVGGLYGGAIADVVDRKRLAIAASTGLAAASLVLAIQAYAGWHVLWLVYAMVGLQGLFFAVNNPSRNAMLPRLLPAELLTAANALSQLSFQLGLTVGPLLAGLIIGWFGLGAAYTVDVVSFLAALYALLRLPPMPVTPRGNVGSDLSRPRRATSEYAAGTPIHNPHGDTASAGRSAATGGQEDEVAQPVRSGSPWREAGLASVLEGLRFLRTRPNVLMTFLTDMCAMILAMPRALFPALAATRYGGGSRTVGLLTASIAIGSVICALFSGWTGRVRRQGLAVLIAVSMWGFAIAGFGVSPWLWLAVGCLAIAGAADMVSAVYRNTILQVATPDQLRGRLQGVFVVVVAGGPRLGDFTAGTVASLRTETFAAVTGGLLCVTVVWLLAARYRGFLAYDARHPTP
jgi:MFS family permease